MKGLLIKDVRLLASQKNFFVVVIVVALIVMITTENPSFAVGYVTFLFPMFTLSTISYDEFDNGYAFLFTLPITRKEYVFEKYIYGLLMGGISWLCVTLITMIYQMAAVPGFQAKEWLVSSACMISIMVLLLSVVIPLVMKFGGEKGRIVLMMIIGAFIAVVFVLNACFDSMQMDLGEGLEQVFLLLESGAALGIVCVVMIIILLLSIKISMRIMRKKEL